MHNKISNAVDYWIYLAVEENWNKTAETPWKRLYSPLCRIPDPSFTITGGFNFHGFELLLGEDEINSLYQNSSYLLTDEELKTLKEKLGDDYNNQLRSWVNGTGIGTESTDTLPSLMVAGIWLSGEMIERSFLGARSVSQSEQKKKKMRSSCLVL